MDSQAVRVETAEALRSRLATAQRESRVPALIAGLVRAGAPIWDDARGFAGDGVRPDRDTRSRIGSITKPFTAVLVARLRDEGRLDFSDPLDKHLTDTPLGDRTIGQLLSHSSGLQAESDGPWWERTPGAHWPDFAPKLSAEMARHRQGSRFHYSNLGYGLLGEVVARLRGTTWADALREEILEPLELRRTSYAPQPPHLDGFAVHPWADVVLPEPHEDAGAMAPAGQLWSTVGDLGRFAAFLAGDTGGVLHPDTLEEMRTPNAVEDGEEWTRGYGLGLQVLKVDGRTLVGHGGSMPGYLAGVYVDVERTAGVALLANTTSGFAPLALGTELLRVLQEREPYVASDWTPDPAQKASLDVVGPWYWGSAAFALRAKADGWLDLGPVNGWGRGSRFKPSGRTDEWTGLDGYYAGEALRAVRGPDGSVAHLDLNTFIFTRTPYDPGAPVPGGVEPGGWR